MKRFLDGFIRFRKVIGGETFEDHSSTGTLNRGASLFSPTRMEPTGAAEVSAYENTVDTLFRFELENDLFELRVEGVPIWEWLRFDVHRAVLQRRGILSNNPSGSGARYRTYPRGLWLWAKNLVSRNPFMAAPAERLYWGHHRRKRLEDGYWWDIYTDPIHEKEDASFVHVEAPHEFTHRTPARTEGIRYTDFIEYSGRIADNLPGLGVSLNPSDRATVSGLESALARTLDVSLDLTSMVEARLSQRAVTRPLYRRMVTRVDPDVAIVVVGYTKETFIEVCKEEAIPVVELQHGGFGRHHPGYAFPGDRSKQTAPDYLFTFGEFWSDSVELPMPRENVIPIGYPHLERQRKRDSNVDTTDAILFLSQWSIGEALTKFAVEFAKREDDRSVIVKLHPGEYATWREEYPWLDGAPLTVIDGDEPPLYELLASSSVQVGVYTTVIYEGLNFGLDTYLLDLPGVSRMEHLIDQGGATLVESVDELREATRASDGRGFVDVDYYFEPNAIENFEEALAEVVEREV